MSQYKIGDIVLRRGVNLAAYITDKYTSLADTPLYNIYYWKLGRVYDRFREDELEPLTMENVDKCQ